jgi:asparagine synthase (glutamine-hydrolysing)
MCGIFGAVSLTGAPLAHPGCLAEMARVLAHRGPDGERIVGHGAARLGARRLAIMDLTTGDQPFQSPDGAVWMVCNGEIYNAPALREEARGWGYPFRSTGDIENIVPFYERFGPAAVARLDGMFGLAIWDDARRRLVLARDRAGEKPLFWTRVGSELRFASEIQALLVYPDQRRRLDTAATELYGALGYVPAPQTMFEGIQKLPPGHLLIAEKAEPSIRPYWSPQQAAAAPPRLASAEQLRQVLLTAVERELMSDVPVGVFTSGGLDSSFLAGAASRVMRGEQIHTYAARFVDRGYDESAHAEAVTHDIRTVHHVVTADDAALGRAFDVVAGALAEPVGDPAILPTYLLADAARADVKVILSGEGADELFGGYPTYLGHRAADLYRRLPHPARRVVRWAVEQWPASTGKVTLEFLLKQFVTGAERDGVARHASWFGALGPTPGALARLDTLLEGFPEDGLNRMLWLDFMTYLPDNLLVKVDRGTMLASIEARAPYLDREVLELALPAPSRLKVRGVTTKAILKEAARGIVPPHVIARRKRGLSVPVARWLNGGLADLASEHLARPRLFPGAPTASLLAEHRAGRRNHARKLWPILMAELWAARWKVETEPTTSGAG